MLKFEEAILNHIPKDDSADHTEQMLLYWLVRATKPKVVLEVGTHRGLTTLYIAHALYDNKKGKIITCDPNEWGQRGNFRVFPELEKLIEFRQQGSQDIDIDEKIDFLFLDGMHEYEWVTMEIKKFLPKLSKYGVVVFHDAAGDGNEVGTNQAVIDLGLESAWIPTPNCIRIYGHMKNPPRNKHAINDNLTYEDIRSDSLHPT